MFNYFLTYLFSDFSKNITTLEERINIIYNGEGQIIKLGATFNLSFQ